MLISTEVSARQWINGSDGESPRFSRSFSTQVSEATSPFAAKSRRLYSFACQSSRIFFLNVFARLLHNGVCRLLGARQYRRIRALADGTQMNGNVGFFDGQIFGDITVEPLVLEFLWIKSLVYGNGEDRAKLVL